MLTIRIEYSREIEEREILAHLHRNPYRQGTDRALLVECRDREEADLIVNSITAPGIKAAIIDEVRVH